MHHFFIEPSCIEWSKKSGVITGSDVHHIKQVLRLSKESPLIVSDGLGNRYQAMIADIGIDEIAVRLLEKESLARGVHELPIRLVQGVAKGNKMDWIIQKNTEMGVFAIQPMMTTFTVVKFPGEKEAKKKQIRWQKIAEEAAKQSKRTTIPEVAAPETMERLLQQRTEKNDGWLSLLAYEKETGVQLNQLIRHEALKEYEGVEIWIGPEGGFSEEEVAKGRAAGIRTVGLGPRILRAETASIVLVSVIMYEMGVLEA